MISSVSLFLAFLHPLVLAQDNDVATKDLPGMGYLFTAYDTSPNSGCTTDAPVLFKKHLQLSYCYKGSPSLFNGLNYGSATCAGAYDGSFMIEGVSENVFNVRRYPGPGCIQNGANVPDEKINATNKCITSSGSFNFAFPLKYENDFGPQVFAETYANRSPKNVAVAVCPRPTTTATSVTVTSTSSSTGSASSVTGTATASTTASSTATKTGTVVSAASPVTGSIISVAAVAIAIGSFM